MREAIRLYGYAPSFQAKAGPLTAIVEVGDGAGEVLIDPERGRCRVAAIPGTDLDRWTSPVGVLLIARRGAWGLSIAMDEIPGPAEEEVARMGDATRFKRPYLPRDLASCPACRDLVIVRREKEGPGFLLVTPTWRLASRARELIKSWGFFGFVAKCRGKGRKAGLAHGPRCSMPLFAAFTFREPVKIKKKRATGRRTKEVDLDHSGHAQ